METLLHSHSRLIQDHGCKPAVEKETYRITILNYVFGLVRNRHKFSSRRIDFTPKTYFQPVLCQQRLERRLEHSFRIVKQLPFHFAPLQIQE